jgi:hypothetical protein
MSKTAKPLTNFLIELGIEQVPHSGKTYLAHLVNVHRLMETQGCAEEVCRAGMFHSIYGTAAFQGFMLPLEARAKVRGLIGAEAERLAYLNCAMDRPSFDRALEQSDETYRFTDRLTGEEISLTRTDFDDLCRVHLYDWLEQAPRSRLGWDYRRAAYRRLAERLGAGAVALYDQVFAREAAKQAD